VILDKPIFKLDSYIQQVLVERKDFSDSSVKDEIGSIDDGNPVEQVDQEIDQKCSFDKGAIRINEDLDASIEVFKFFIGRAPGLFRIK
jgi:hypothetical protein